MDIDRIRVLLQNAILLIIAFLSPLKYALIVLFVISMADVFGGVAGNVWTGKEQFHFRKAFRAVYKLIVYCALVILTHVATHYMGEQELSKILIKYLTWVISYWYFVNILSNLRKAFPLSPGIAFLYLLLTLKILPIILGKTGIGGDDAKEIASKALHVVSDEEIAEGNESDGKE